MSAERGGVVAGGVAARIWARALVGRSVRTKILLVAAVAAVSGVVVGAVAVRQLTVLGAEAGVLYRDGAIATGQVGEIRRLATQARLDSLGVRTARTEEARATNTQALRQTDAALDHAVAVYGRRQLPAQQRSSLADFVRTWARYRAVRDELAAVYAGGDFVTYERRRAAELTPLSDRAQQDLSKLNEATAATARQRLDHLREQRNQAVAVLVVVLGAGSLLAVAFGALTTRSVMRGVREVDRVADGLAAGDLTIRARPHCGDELGRAVGQLDHGTTRVADLVRQLTGDARALASAGAALEHSRAVVADRADAAQERTGQLRGQVDTVATSVGALSSAAQQLAESIQEIAGNAAEAATTASQAVATSETARTTITSLGNSSAEIGDVLSLITSIAGQINLLALNATIEAARAGEAGKGFAVVAGEVKDLARETATATDDIARRVNAIQQDTARSVDAIGRVAETVARISRSQAAITDVVARQQSVMAEINRNAAQVTDGTRTISEVAQTTIDAVVAAARSTGDDTGEVAALAPDLVDMSAALAATLTRFRI